MGIEFADFGYEWDDARSEEISTTRELEDEDAERHREDEKEQIGCEMMFMDSTHRSWDRLIEEEED